MADISASDAAPSPTNNSASDAAPSSTGTSASDAAPSPTNNSAPDAAPQPAEHPGVTYMNGLIKSLLNLNNYMWELDFRR